MRLQTFERSSNVVDCCGCRGRERRSRFAAGIAGEVHGRLEAGYAVHHRHQPCEWCHSRLKIPGVVMEPRSKPVVELHAERRYDARDGEDAAACPDTQ